MKQLRPCLVSAMLVFSVFALFAEELQPLELAPPGTQGGQPLMQVLKERRTIRELKSDKLPLQLLSDLLWAAFGINRDAEGRRTAPSAMNSQEVELYVALSQGLYLYEAKPNRLKPVLNEDVRKRTGGPESAQVAPVVVIYVADLSRLDKAKPDTRLFYAGFDSGCICQNVYLFCASTGLATVVHEVEREPLAKAMGLRPEQSIILVQNIGYPREMK